MIQGQDILSDYPEAELQSMAKGYVTKCDSPSGICFDILELKYAYHGKINGEFPKRKSRAKFYLMYTTKTYRMAPDDMSEFRRTEYSLADGTPIFTNDCNAGHGHCSHLETIKVAELFNKYRSMEYRKSKKIPSKVIRKPVKKVVKKCKCK